MLVRGIVRKHRELGYQSDARCSNRIGLERLVNTTCQFHSGPPALLPVSTKLFAAYAVVISVQMRTIAGFATANRRSTGCASSSTVFERTAASCSSVGI